MLGSKKLKLLNLDEHHPFAQGLFDDFNEHLSRGFANLTNELNQMTRYVKRSRLLAVQGPLGSGKTTLLRHFFSTRLPRGTPVLFLQLSSEAFSRPFTQIAIAVLRSCTRRKKDGFIRINSSLKMDFKNELVRLEGELRKETGLKIELAPEVDVNGLVKLKVGSASAERTIGSTLGKYDDADALNMLRDLFHNSENRFFVILDDFHYLRRHRENEDYYQDFVLFTETVNRVLRHRNVTFVITLDDLVLKKRYEFERKGGGRARLFTDEEIEIKGFTPEGIFDMINRRLTLFDYSTAKPPRFTGNAISAICLASKGNPRAILDIIRHALDFAEDNNVNMVDLEQVIDAVHQLQDVSIDEIDIKILTYLRDHGPASPSDSMFQKSVGKSRQTLQRRLPELEKIGVIASQTGGASKNPSTEYSIPVIK